MGLSLGDTAPDFEAETTEGQISFHDWIGDSWAVLFLAQFYGVPLTITQQVTVVFICILGGIGTAGVPAGSIPVVAMILGLVGVPVEGIGMILGVDRFLDMCRTTLNVTGDLAAAVVVARGELPIAEEMEVEG